MNNTDPTGFFTANDTATMYTPFHLPATGAMGAVGSGLGFATGPLSIGSTLLGGGAGFGQAGGSYNATVNQAAVGGGPPPGGTHATAQNTPGPSQTFAQDHRAATCGGAGDPRCGNRRFGGSPMDRLVLEFLERFSPDPAYPGMNIAETILHSAAPEHAAHIIRAADGAFRLGRETLTSGAYQDMVTVTAPSDLATGEEWVGLIHSHPGATGGPLVQSRMDIEAANFFSGHGLRQSYVVGTSGNAPHFEVILFEPRPPPGTLSPLSVVP